METITVSVSVGIITYYDVQVELPGEAREPGMFVGFVPYLQQAAERAIAMGEATLTDGVNNPISEAHSFVVFDQDDEILYEQ